MVRYILKSKNYNKADAIEKKVTASDIIAMDMNMFDYPLVNLCRTTEYVHEHPDDNYLVYIDKKDNKVKKIATWVD